jgi:hypothetical protein
VSETTRTESANDLSQASRMRIHLWAESLANWLSALAGAGFEQFIPLPRASESGWLSTAAGRQTSGTAIGTTRPIVPLPCGAVASGAHALDTSSASIGKTLRIMCPSSSGYSSFLRCRKCVSPEGGSPERNSKWSGLRTRPSAFDASPRSIQHPKPLGNRVGRQPHIRRDVRI